MIFKVSHKNADSRNKISLKALLSTLSKDVLECVNEEFFLIWHADNLETFSDLIKQYNGSSAITDISICSREEFNEAEILEFFDHIQQSIKQISNIFAKPL